MASIEKNLKYKIIKNILNAEEIDIIKEYLKYRHFNNLECFDDKQSNNYDTYFYKDPLIQTFLIKKKNIIEKAVQKDLLPSYSFFRLYTYNAELKKHLDRKACELSVTIFVDADKPDWPLYIDGEPIVLKPGEGIVYSGTQYEHWREKYDGDYHMQFFLHYVYKDGEYKELAGDPLVNGEGSL